MCSSYHSGQILYPVPSLTYPFNSRGHCTTKATVSAILIKICRDTKLYNMQEPVTVTLQQSVRRRALQSSGVIKTRSKPQDLKRSEIGMGVGRQIIRQKIESKNKPRSIGAFSI